MTVNDSGAVTGDPTAPRAEDHPDYLDEQERFIEDKLAELADTDAALARAEEEKAALVRALRLVERVQVDLGAEGWWSRVVSGQLGTTDEDARRCPRCGWDVGHDSWCEVGAALSAALPAALEGG